MTAGGFRLIANPEAGSVDDETVTAVIEALQRTAPAELIWVESEADVDAALESLGATIPVFVGGDGSLNIGLSRLDSLGLLDRVVGYIPAGTGNDFGRDVGLGVEPSEAARLVSGGSPVMLPLLRLSDGEGNDRIAANNVHLGLGPIVAAEAAGLKEVIGRLAYPVTAAKVATTGDGIDVDVHLDGESVHRGATLFVAALLGRYMGGGVEVSEVRHLDRKMETVVVAAGAASDRVSLALAAVRGRPDDHDDLLRRQGSCLTIDSEESIEAVVDGEVASFGTHLEIELVVDGWTALLPGTGSGT